jgi:hypothetical protein
METLYDELNSCIKSVCVRIEGGAEYDSDMPEVAHHLSEATNLCYRNARNKIIRKHARESYLVTSVLEGKRTFLDLSRPIITRVNELEAKLTNGEIRRVRKRDILGKDGRAAGDVAEVVDYLRENRVIDPRKIFKSVGCFYEKAGNLIRKHTGKTLLFTTIAPAAIMFYLSHSEAPRDRYLMTGVIAMMGLLLPGLTLSELENKFQSTLSKQRRDFESALNFLDENVKSARETLR